MTSSTPEPRLWVEADGRRVDAGGRLEVPGRGDLRVRSAGHEPGADVELWVGHRVVELVADELGVVRWVGERLLGQVAGEVRVAVGDDEVVLSVRPDKLVAAAVSALVAELEAVAEGLAQDVGAVGTGGALRSRDSELHALDAAVGLAADAAPAIRRRPLHRAREVVRAVPRDQGPRTAADVRWLATHPVAAARAAATGRPVGVVRERRADLDTLENRGVLAAYDRLHTAAVALREVVEAEVGRVLASQATREAFVTESGSLWSEKDLPRLEALRRRRARLEALTHEIGATRTRSGLPDLRPRGARMVRTARVDAHPAYWATFRAFEAAEAAAAGEAPPAPAPVRALDELWEQWVAVVAVRALVGLLGRPESGRLVDPGWFSTLRRGPIASWSDERRRVVVSYEPSFAAGSGELRKLFPGRPWRPDLVVDVAWADGTRDLHVLDAKYRLEAGGPPREALRELWWRYGEGIGDARGRPVVRSLWVVAPGGDGSWLVAPGMLREDWPVERLRGGCVSIGPGGVAALGRVLSALLA
jgi:hypothetical protein